MFRKHVAALASVALAVLTIPATALAASDFSQNVSDEAKAWGSALLLAVAALVGLPALAKRDLNQSFVIALIALVLGGFIFATEDVENIIKNLWQTFS